MSDPRTCINLSFLSYENFRCVFSLLSNLISRGWSGNWQVYQLLRPGSSDQHPTALSTLRTLAEIRWPWCTSVYSISSALYFDFTGVVLLQDKFIIYVISAYRILIHYFYSIYQQLFGLYSFKKVHLLFGMIKMCLCYEHV